VIVLLITFGLTVIVDLTVAIEVGMVLAAFLFMRRMAEVTNVSVITREFAENVLEHDPQPLETVGAVGDMQASDGWAVLLSKIRGERLHPLEAVASLHHGSAGCAQPLGVRVIVVGPAQDWRKVINGSGG
jgi:hypothetical protein